MDRRSFLLGAAGVGAAALGAGWLLRPEDRGAGGHGAYFEKLTTSLRKHGLARPTMLVDLDQVDFNTNEVVRALGRRDFRVVAKSLPSIPLLSHIMDEAKTPRLMVFHEPFLASAARTRPDADLLLGKPMPVAAAAAYYARPRVGAFDPARQLQWLVDTPERLRQYRELAAGQGVLARINVEIDVGLHRGGVRDPAELARMLEVISEDPNLRFAGLMGYEPHVAVLPGGLQAREFERVQAIYRDMLEAVRAQLGEPRRDALVMNAAGSPTYRLWSDVAGLASELAIGSGLVKPLNFDIPTLESHRPGLYVATPVLKASDGLLSPGLQAVADVQQAWNPNRARTFFVYGGYWKAEPVSPPGLTLNPFFGRSTNQEMLTGSAQVELEVDDFVFLRPTQSEFVMLQFGDLAMVRNGEIVDFWAPFAADGSG